MPEEEKPKEEKPKEEKPQEREPISPGSQAVRSGLTACIMTFIVAVVDAYLKVPTSVATAFAGLGTAVLGAIGNAARTYVFKEEQAGREVGFIWVLLAQL